MKFSIAVRGIALLCFVFTQSLILNAQKRSETESILKELSARYDNLRPLVIQPAEGYLKYPYLIPAGFYKQMWDWDGFFMANHFISRNKPEYMKYWVLNLAEGIDSTGYVSGCATTEGPRPVFGKFSMKPFLSQGAYLASVKTNAFTWLEKHYASLMKVLEYRDKTQLDKKYGLYFWDNAMQSGADNNPALNYFWQEDHRSFLACDMNTFQLRELLAQAIIAEKLGHREDAAMLSKKAKLLKGAINKYLWCNQDKMYYNVDRETGNYYKRISYSCFVPLMQKLLPEADGKAMIKRYLLSAESMKGSFGFRSLSLKDPDYNNKNVIVPFSNWQGPVWPIANYIYSIGLKKYGFDNDLIWLANTLGKLMIKDIKEWGMMHENYNADTGAPLAPSADHVDKNGKFVGFISWNLCIQNILEGVVNGKWMLLDIPEIN